MWGFDDSTGEVGCTLNQGVLNNATPRGTVGGSWFSNSNGPGSVTLQFASTIAAANTSYVGFGWRTDTASTARSWFQLQDNASAIQISLRWDANRHVQIYRGDGVTLLATSTNVMALNVWYYVEVKANVNSTTGSVDVHVDGISWASFSGNTQQAAFTTLDKVNVGTTVTSGGNGTWADDVYVLDSTGSAPYNTYLGDVTVRTLLPTAAGDLTQWTPSVAPNWDAVNEANSSSTDFVGAATTALKDLYQVTDIPAGSTVYAIQNWVYAAKSDAGVPPAPSPIAKGDGGTTRTDASITLSTTYQHFQGPLYITDPDGDALTVTNVNALQVGVTT